MPSSVSSGLRLISIGNSVPSLRSAVEFHASPHGPHPRIGEKTRAVPRMFVPEAFRHQDLNGLPQQLFSRCIQTASPPAY